MHGAMKGIKVGIWNQESPLEVFNNKDNGIAGR